METHGDDIVCINSVHCANLIYFKYFCIIFAEIVTKINCFGFLDEAELTATVQLIPVGYQDYRGDSLGADPDLSAPWEVLRAAASQNRDKYKKSRKIMKI